MINNSKWQKTLLSKVSAFIFACLMLSKYGFENLFRSVYYLWYTVFPWIIAGGNYFLFPHQKGAIIRWSRLFQILLTGSRALNILFYYPIKQKTITSNKLNMGILSVSNLVPWLIFGAWVVFDWFCWIRFHFNLTGRW